MLHSYNKCRIINSRCEDFMVSHIDVMAVVGLQKIELYSFNKQQKHFQCQSLTTPHMQQYRPNKLKYKSAQANKIFQSNKINVINIRL